MATTFQQNIQPTNSTDALFRLWAVFLRDAILSGLVQTADTGQMDFTTVLAPTAANVKKGYIIARMDDALQATKPVYVRIDFGSGNVTNSPGIWIQIGTGTNGAGTISGSVFANGATSHIYTASNGTGRVNGSHSSVSPSHCAVTMFVEATAAFCLTFSIERGRTSTGAEDGDYVFLQYSPGSTGGQVSQFHNLVRAGGTQVPHVAAPVITCPARPMHTQQDVGYGNILPMIEGSSTIPVNLLQYNDPQPPTVLFILNQPMSYPIPRPPCLGYIVTERDSWTTDAVITVYKYGVPVVYRRIHNENISTPGGVSTSAHTVWQRYE